MGGFAGKAVSVWQPAATLIAVRAIIKAGAAVWRDRIDVFEGIKVLLLTQCSFEIGSRLPERN
jgi:hypothetical protein